MMTFDELKANQEFLFKLVVALLHNAGGEVVINERVMGEASLLNDPSVVTWTDIDTSVTEFHIKLKTKKVDEVKRG